MDDFEDLRDRYEEALDEAEERRREYLEAVRRAGGDGKDVQELATATGMSESRVSSLVGISSPWRRWLVRLALLLVLPLLAGPLLMANAPRATTLGGTAEVQDRASALALAEKLRAVPAIEEIQVNMRSERGWEGATSLFSRSVIGDPTEESVPDPGPGDEIEWSLGFQTRSLDLSGLLDAQEAVSSLLPQEGAASLYHFPGTPGPLFDVGIALIYLTILGWFIAGVVALVRFVRRRWRIVRIDPVTT